MQAEISFASITTIHRLLCCWRFRMRSIVTVTILCLSSFQLLGQTTPASEKTLIVPPLVNYGGVLQDSAGKPLSGVVSVTFSIYKDSQGGTPLWSETQNLQVDSSGRYSVMLGSTTNSGLPEDLFAFGEPRWIGLQVQGGAEQPRALLVAVPYALKASDAATIGGLPPSAFLRATPEETSSTGGSGPPSQITSSSSSHSNTGKSAPPLNSPCSSLSGGGTTNFLPMWTSGCHLNNSKVFQSGGFVGIGTTTPVATLDVKGAINALSTYQIGTSTVLGIGRASDFNLFLGVGSGAHNVVGSGQFNTFSGYQAGYLNTTGIANTSTGNQAGYSNTTASYNTITGTAAGFGNTGAQNTFTGAFAGLVNTANNNTFTGFEAGQSNTSGTDNVFEGWRAGYSNNADENVFVGSLAGYSNTVYCCNTFVGYGAGQNTVGGAYNAFFGRGAGLDNVDGSFNTFLGHWAGVGHTHGDLNTFLGEEAAYAHSSGKYNVFIGGHTGNDIQSSDYDIYIGWQGFGIKAESNTIRIGESGEQFAAYIAGIYGVNNAGVPVYINSNGQLGTSGSSRRFKEQIHDMADSSSKLFQLRPVTFFYKPQYDDGSHSLQYGLIAEEVAKVYPEMVAYEKDGQPYTVKYQLLAPMLLNELQKQHAIVTAQQDLINTQQQQIQTESRQITELQQRLTRLESLLAVK